MKNVFLFLPVLLIFFLPFKELMAQNVFDAIKAGDILKVKELIEKDITLVNTKDPDGISPLIHAIIKNNKGMVELLLDKGAKINEKLNNDRSPLLFAVTRDFEIVKMLVEKGADVNDGSKYQGKPIDMAFERGKDSVVELLKSKGAEYTPLKFDTKKITGDIYCVSYPWGMRNNLLVFSGKEGQIIVDAGFSKRAIDFFKQTISQFDKVNIKYVINTHPHWDHVAGNGMAPNPYAVLGLKKIIEGKFRDILNETGQPWIGKKGDTIPTPYLMKFNNEDIYIFPYPGLHSDEDILIYFSKSKVLCMGDLLLSESCPALKNITAYMKLLEKVLGVFPEECIFISGHGKEITWAGLKKYRDDLSDMITIIKTEYASGKKKNELLKSDILHKYKADYSQLDWLGPDFLIQIIADNLEAEKKNQQTN
jgi:cyclase